jgi:hypothetical protein
MLRFISFLLGRQWEPCQSCENLKQQIAYLREDNSKLTETLMRIVSPKVVEAPPVEVNPIGQTSALFSRRRAAIEAKDREEARILAERKHVAVPDDVNKKSMFNTVEQLERELGVEEKTN